MHVRDIGEIGVSLRRVREKVREEVRESKRRGKMKRRSGGPLIENQYYRYVELLQGT